MPKRKHLTISSSEKLPPSPVSVLRRFANGLTKVSSTIISRHLANECSIKKASLLSLAALALLIKSKRTSFIAELAQKSKNQTWNDKSPSFDLPILTRHLLQTSLRASIGKERDSKPFWNSQCLAISEQLWLPTGIALQDSHLSSSSGSSHPITESLSYMTNQMDAKQSPRVNKSLQRTFLPSSTCIPVDKWEDDAMENASSFQKSIRMQIKPNAHQKALLRKWFGASRYVHNTAVACIKETKISPFDSATMQELRTKLITSSMTYRSCPNCNREHRTLKASFKCPKCQIQVTCNAKRTVRNPFIQEWQEQVPQKIRDGAFKDLQQAYKACLTNLKRGNIKRFDMGFKKRKQRRESIYIEQKDLHVIPGQGYSIYKTVPETDADHPILCKNPQAPSSDVRLTFDGLRYHISFTRQFSKSRSSKNNGVVALDPGVRKFQTCFSESEVRTFGRDWAVIERLWSKIDLLKSKRAKRELKNSPGRRILKLERRIRHIVADVHWKTANYLCSQYTHILISLFGTSKMLSRLAPKTSRKMATLSHYTFRQRLAHVAQKYQGVQVYIVGEEFTSMTCTRCGHLNAPSSDEIKICKCCGLVIDRDVNGSRNIFIKNVDMS